MTKKQIRVMAVLYSANVVYNSMGTGAYSENLSDLDNDRLSKQVTKIGLELIGNNHHCCLAG